MATVETFEDNFKVNLPRAVLLRNEIMQQTAAALPVWRVLIPKFVSRPVDQVKLNSLLDEHKYGRVVLQCLLKWQSAQPQQARYNELIDILREHDQLTTFTGILGNPKFRETIFSAGQPRVLRPGPHGDLEQDDRFLPENFKIRTRNSRSGGCTHTIREYVCQDSDAVENWHEITDLMLLGYRDATVKLGIEKKLDTDKNSEAILTTLEIWTSFEADNATFHKLLGIFSDFALNALIEKLTNEPVITDLRKLEGLSPLVGAGRSPPGPAPSVTAAQAPGQNQHQQMLARMNEYLKPTISADED